jgi:hypothetical protein
MKQCKQLIGGHAAFPASPSGALYSSTRQAHHEILDDAITCPKQRALTLHFQLQHPIHIPYSEITKPQRTQCDTRDLVTQAIKQRCCRAGRGITPNRKPKVRT